MKFCLLPKVADKFKEDIISGKINPSKLAGMTSAERRSFFAATLGETNAEPVNRLFESKLLLKNQQAGFINWANNLIDASPQVKRDLISRIQRMDKVLSPADESAFLEDLASYKLGTNVSFDEAKTVTELSEAMQKAKDAMESGGDRLAYGRARVALKNYTEELLRKTNSFSLTEFKKNPLKGGRKLVTEAAGNTKAIRASLDNSAIFRQGWKTLWTHPTIWAKNAKKTFRDLWDTLGGKEVMDELNADIVSRENSLNGYYDKAKLDVGNIEEAYPTSLPEKIPGFGRVYKASENAYTGFARKTRADVFDKYIEIAKKTGVELTDDELLSIGKMVNSLTGRSHLGKLEPIAPELNNFFFSPRFVKSHFDVLLQLATGAGGSNFVRKQAAINLLKIIGGTAAVLTVANAVKPGSVEWDPRSSDFGKIKIGKTRFDVTGGMGSVVTLAARWAKNSSKSSTTGKVSQLGERDKDGKLKWGTRTRFDVGIDFLMNKASPIGAVLRDMSDGETFSGEKPTLRNQLPNLLIPMPVTNWWEDRNNSEAANQLLRIIADGLGIGTNTY